MEDNKLYPEQKETPVTVQGEDAEPLREERQTADPGSGQDSFVQDAGQDVIQDVEFIEQPYAAEDQAAQSDRSWQGGGNQDNRPWQDGSGQDQASWQDNAYKGNGSWQNGNAQNYTPYQDSGYRYGGQENNQYGQDSGYQQNPYYNGYGNTACQDPYQNSYRNNSQNGYQDNSQNDYQNGYQDNSQNGYQNNWQESYRSNYQNSYRNNYQNGYQNNSQTELEEPVRISEWVLALVLMMIPCVNIIMMFVWAFSSTEKKSKSNFFKAYLIFFGISMGVMLLIWLAVIVIALAL